MHRLGLRNEIHEDLSCPEQRRFSQSALITAKAMNEIADSCGLGNATLYHCDRDKGEVLAHIADAHVSRLVALCDSVARDADCFRVEPNSRANFDSCASMPTEQITLSGRASDSLADRRVWSAYLGL